MGGGRGEGGARESISVLDRETKTGQCLNIEHMSLSPLKRANENRSHHCGPPYVRPSCRTEREKERDSLCLPVLRPRVCCYAASSVFTRFSRPSCSCFLPSFPFFSFYISPVCSRDEGRRGRGLQENVGFSLSPSIHLSTFLFAINGSRFVKGIYCFER